MRWPIKIVTGRQAARPQANYTGAVVDAIVANATGNATATAHATAALEACAALYASAFAVADVQNAPGDVRGILTPSTLALVARDLIQRGESVHRIVVNRRGMRLQPAGSFDVRGDPDPATWYYRCDEFGPSGNVTRLVPAAGVLHCKYAVDPARPWHGLGPLQWARATGQLAGALESRLADEAAAPTAYALPQPADAIPAQAAEGEEPLDPFRKVRQALATARGKTMFVETSRGGFGKGADAAPSRDWEQKRIGADWPEVLRTTRSDTFDAVANACLVPPALLDAGAEGTSQREALRRWRRVGLGGLARVVGEELAGKLDAPGLRLTFAALRASDLAGAARAYGTFRKADLDDATARNLAGLDE